MVERRSLGLIATAIVLTSAAVSPLVASCPEVFWEKVIDRQSEVPGINGPWAADGGVVVSGDRVGFLAYTDDFRSRGFFVGRPGEIKSIVGSQTSFPGGVGNFKSIGFVSDSVDGDSIAFVARDDGGLSPFSSALFKYVENDGVELVIDTNLTVPGGSERIVGMNAPSLDGGTLGFSATGFESKKESAYLWRDGELVVLATADTSVPGGDGTFDTFGSVRVSSSSAAFLARDSNVPFFTHGFYFWQDGELRLVADGRTEAPGGTGTFAVFLSFSLLGDTVYLVLGDRADDTALYRWDDGIIQRLADENTLDLAGNPIGPPSHVYANEAGLLLTTGHLFGGKRVYLDQGSGPCLVFSDGQELEGDPATLWQAPAALGEEGYLAIRVHTESGNSAIYRGKLSSSHAIPTLGGWGLGLMLVAIAVASTRLLRD